MALYLMCFLLVVTAIGTLYKIELLSEIKDFLKDGNKINENKLTGAVIGVDTPKEGPLPLAANKTSQKMID